MGLDVESSCGPGLGFPLGFWFLLGFRVSDELVGGEYSTCVQVWSRGSCHFWGEGTPPHSVLETLRLRSGRTEFPCSQISYPYAGKREGEEVVAQGDVGGEGFSSHDPTRVHR